MADTRTRPLPALPPASLSMFDPVFVGVDEYGRPVYLDFSDQVGIILAGEPGSGKSVGLGNIVAHGALAHADCRLTLIDGALVELGIWRGCADEFVGPDINHAISVLERQQQQITDCCQMLLDTRRRKIVKSDGEPMHVTVIDELAYYSATVGTKAEREKFNTTLRDCAGRQLRRGAQQGHRQDRLQRRQDPRHRARRRPAPRRGQARPPPRQSRLPLRRRPLPPRRPRRDPRGPLVNSWPMKPEDGVKADALSRGESVPGGPGACADCGHLTLWHGEHGRYQGRSCTRCRCRAFTDAPTAPPTLDEIFRALRQAARG
jgi:hypothetical protein